MSIEVTGITKRFGNFTALDRIELSVTPGELLALLGPSGSGKTTLLRIIAGLEIPDDGTIRFQGEDMLARPPRDRGVGFVFQHYALFRHMSVFENVAFGLRVRPRNRRPRAADLRARVDRLLELVQLGPLAHRYPNQLSGGQRQRVALARALAIEPQVLLLDEPFGALDAKVRKELRRWLRRLHDEVHVTSVFVTHDQEEAFELADRVVVMGQGRIEQIGSPAEVYAHPASAFVCDFLGEVNRLRVVAADRRLRLEGGDAVIGTAEDLDGTAVVYVRHHDVSLAAPGTPGYLPGRVRAVRAVAAAARVDLDLGGQDLEAVIPLDRLQTLDLSPDSPVGIRFTRALAFGHDGTAGRPVAVGPA